LFPKCGRLILALAVVFFAVPLFADNVVISGTQNFSALDGSSLDHDHVVNGVFTVSDGDLTINGTVNCNDFDRPSSGCAMQFVASGNITLSGASLYEENRIRDGNG